MLDQQFAHPRGVAGRLVGRFMARKNAVLTRRAVTAVPLQGDETVLELGCGPGVGLLDLARALPRGRVVGADPSALMRAQAARRVRPVADRVEIVDVAADALPWPAGTFAAVYAVNSVQLWHPLRDCLAAVATVLAPAGVLVLGLTEHAVQADGTTIPHDMQDRLAEALRATGFEDQVAEWRRGGNGRELLVLARRR